MGYDKAAMQGVREANQFKIVMLGAEGAGKTCTVHSLLGKRFQPDQPSTVGADIHTSKVDRICFYDWKEREFQDDLREISIHYKHEMIKVSSKVSKSQRLVSESAGREVLQNTETPAGTTRIVIYDLGGQEIYYEVQFLFLASLDIVFLTFNASVDLDKPVARRHHYKMDKKTFEIKETLTNYQIIEATLHIIYSHCGMEGFEGSVSDRNPTVMMIATHSFNLDEDQKKIIVDTLFNRLPLKLLEHLPRNTKDAIHFIDNDKRDLETFHHLKTLAKEAAAFTVTEKCPIAYLKFEEKILTLSQKKTEISKEEAFDIAKEAGLEPTDEALQAVLEHYALNGILLYYSNDDALKNTIFVSPQRVSDLVTCVIKIHDYEEPRPSADLRLKYERFNKYGLLEEELLDDMLERRKILERKKLGYMKDYDKGTVLGLLEKFYLAIEVDRGTRFESEDSSYPLPDSGRVFFVPSMLVYNKPKGYKTPEGSIDNVVLYYFPDKFLPEIVFNRVLIITTKWCKVEGHRIHRYVIVTDIV